MSNKEDKKKAPSFPEPFEYLNEELAPHFMRYHELIGMQKAYNEKEGKSEKPNVLKLVLTPPTIGIGGPSNNLSQNNSKIDNEFRELDSFLTRKIENLIKENELDEKLSGQLRETLIERKYPNPFRNKSLKEIESLRTTNKDYETSAQFLLDQRQRFKEKNATIKAEVNVVAENEVNQETANIHIKSVTDKFMKSLSYSKAKETSIEKIIDFNKNKDMIIEK